jgi:two-component system response regulator RegX3
VHVGWLRGKLGDPRWVHTVRGVGFRFEGPSAWS